MAFTKQPGNRPDAPRVTSVRNAVIALGICAVTIAGCSSLERPEAAMPLAAPYPDVATKTPPAALSPSAYQERLRNAGSVVAPLFDRLAEAGSPEDARIALEQASTAALEAARLLGVDPPAEVLPVHRDLLAGLGQLAADLSDLFDLSELNDQTASREFLPALTTMPERRLANGRLVDSRRRTGRGRLEFDNGTEHDAVVKLVQVGKLIVYVYVGKGSNTTVGKINDDSCELFFASGTDWDGKLETFTRPCRFRRFEEPAKFTTTSVEGGIRYTIQSVGLKFTIDGNARPWWFPPSRS